MVSYRRLRSKLRGFESKTKDGERTLPVSVTVALKLISVLILVKKICRIPIIHNIPTISPIFKGSNLSMVSIKKTMPIPPSYTSISVSSSLNQSSHQSNPNHHDHPAMQINSINQYVFSQHNQSNHLNHPTISTIQPS